MSCKVYMTLSLYLGMVSIAISNFLVLLRLWILWDNNQRLIAWTIFLYVLTQIASVITTTLIVVQIVPLLHHDLDTNICFMNQKVDIASLWIPGIIFELMVFLTTWWNALSRPRSLETPLSRALYRDGILYFGTLFGMCISRSSNRCILTNPYPALRITNLVMALSAPLSLIFLGVFFIWSISNITLARLVLNCRKLTVAAIKEAKAKAARPIGEGERSSTALSFMDGDVELSAMCEDVYIDAENVRRSRVTMPRPPGLYDV
ncbi:hypothetical protein PLICRDRAFT_529450 [Plicaturopsis crispa FD-325 SS-3]|nr:hypothetical protein PLICRDRAFT_529450 [Plicaturopsis crispa FD-325 SS-3]